MSESKSPQDIRFLDRALSDIVTSAWFWGLAVTSAFYAALPLLPIHQESIARFLLAGLFCLGTITLLKAMRTIQSALTSHADQLAAARTEFAAMCEQTCKTILDQATESQAALIEQQKCSAALIAETWKSFHVDLTATRDSQTLSMTRLTDSMTGAVMGWSDRLEDATRAMNDQVRELRVQASMLLKLTEQESELVRLEERLAQNLDSVRVADSLEGTLLNLNAAVNLMTSRVDNKAA